MLLISDPIFCDPWEDTILPVIELTNAVTELDTEHFYLVGNLVYRFVHHKSLSEVKPGSIIKVGPRYFIEPHNEETEPFYQAGFIVSKEEYEHRVDGDFSDADMLRSYARNYKRANNIIKSGNIRITPLGEIYMPELDINDDPLERIIKLMLRHMKLVLNEYRGQFAKKHGLDNIKSALNGATKNMSILKFLVWCQSFELDWEITIDDIEGDIPSPLKSKITLNNLEPYPWVDIPEESQDIFTVPLTKGEDPLKRGVKLALWQKQLDIREYRRKSPTQHLLNNMKSALRSKQKMTLPYFLSWCEIIDMIFSFRVLNRKDGIWYKITGYDVTTNDTMLE